MNTLSDSITQNTVLDVIYDKPDGHKVASRYLKSGNIGV